MDQPIDGRHVSVPAWIECLDDTLNGLVVAALVLASMTQMGLLYQGGKLQSRSFSLAAYHAAPASSIPSALRSAYSALPFETVSSGVCMSSW